MTRMKAAATAKTDAGAKKAAVKVVEIVDEYKGKVDTAAAKHQAFGAEARKTITEILSEILSKISTHAVASTKSAPPVAFPKVAIDGWSAALQTVKGQMSANDVNAFGGPFLTTIQTPVRNALNAVDDAGKRGDNNALDAGLKALRAQLAETVTVLNQWATKSAATRNKAREDLVKALQSLLEVTNATAAKLRG